jgi:hypothetical protein
MLSSFGFSVPTLHRDPTMFSRSICALFLVVAACDAGDNSSLVEAPPHEEPPPPTAKEPFPVTIAVNDLAPISCGPVKQLSEAEKTAKKAEDEAQGITDPNDYGPRRDCKGRVIFSVLPAKPGFDGRVFEESKQPKPEVKIEATVKSEDGKVLVQVATETKPHFPNQQFAVAMAGHAFEQAGKFIEPGKVTVEVTTILNKQASLSETTQEIDLTFEEQP